MTKREFFEMATTGTLTAEGIEFAAKALETLDATNAKRAATANSKRAAENAPVIEAIRKVLIVEPKLTTTIAAEAGITTSKASAMLLQMAEHGEVVKSEISVKGKGKQKAWALAPTQE